MPKGSRGESRDRAPGAVESRDQAPGARRGRPSAECEGGSVTGTAGRVGEGVSDVG